MIDSRLDVIINYFRTLSPGGGSITLDDTVVQNGQNAVKSGGIYNHVNAIEERLLLGLGSVQSSLNTKQDELVSGVDIKTFNNKSVLGAGNIDVTDVYDAGDLSSSSPYLSQNSLTFICTNKPKIIIVHTDNTELSYELKAIKQNQETTIYYYNSITISDFSDPDLDDNSIYSLVIEDSGENITCLKSISSFNADISIDNSVTENGLNPVKSSGIYTFVNDAVSSKISEITDADEVMY